MSNKMRGFLIICGIIIGVGLVFGVIGTALGGLKGLSAVQTRVPWVNFGAIGEKSNETKSVDSFKSVNLKCDMGKVEFIEGDEYKVDITYNTGNGAPVIEVSGDQLSVETKQRPIGLFNWGESPVNRDTSIKIYYPKGTEFDDVEINNDLGDLRIDHLTAENLKIDLDAGNASLNAVEADRLTAKLNCGNLEGKKLKTKGLDAELDMGRINLDGAFYGTTKADCDMGDCTLTTSVPKDDYTFMTSVDMGKCDIDGMSVKSGMVSNKGAENSMELTCDMGNITIDFK